MARKGDKPAKRTTMQDVQEDIRKRNGDLPKLFGMEPKINLSETDKQAIKNLEEKMAYNPLDDKVKKINEYNKNIYNLNEKYASFRPFNDILVRVVLKSPLEGRVIVPIVDKIPIMTRNAQGVLHEIENPFPFSTKVVIVSVPDNEKFIKPGDTMVIPPIPAKAPIPGNDYILEVPYSFWLPEWEDVTPPKDPSNEHYGYLLISRGLLKGWLNKTEVNE